MRLFLILLFCTCAKADLLQQLLKYENLTATSEFVCLGATVGGVSEKCAQQLNIVCKTPTLFWTMLDASSKFPYSGLGYATRIDFGNFDQCMTAHYENDGIKILGKYCTVGLAIPDIFGNLSDASSFYKLSLCKPDACSADDYNGIASQYIAEWPPLFQDIYCQTVETNSEFTAADIITIFIFAVVILLMTVSTSYDIYIYSKKYSSPNPLYVAFSVFTNGKKLLRHSKNKEEIQCFHGLRVISMMWIIAGHGMAGIQYANVSNAIDVETFQSKRYSGYITTANLAVDTFFFLSGFLLGYQYMKQRPKPLIGHLKSIPYAIVYRYLRLTPPVLMIFLFVISIYPHFGAGPLWIPSVVDMADQCKRRWWPYFLYIQNYYNWEDICLIPTWFLSANMQMFIISPLILIPVALHLRKTSGFTWAMIEMLIINLFCIALPLGIKLVYRDYANIYDTHSSFIDFSVGIMLGVFMRVKINKPFLYMVKSYNIPIINLSMWILMILGMLTIVICFKEVEMNHGYESQEVFKILMRPSWCIGLSWIIYSCHHGYGGIVNWLLTRPVMQVLSRLTYCMYLLHNVCMVYYMGTIQTRGYFNDYFAFYLFCGHYVVTIIVSVFWMLAFESPIIVIEKTLTGKANANTKGTPHGNSKIQEELPKGISHIYGNIEEGPSKAENGAQS